jgi:hypothetical protein
MRMRALGLGGLLGALLFTFAGPAYGASKNVELVDNLPEAKNATAINFLDYKREGDVMLVTGRFGLKSYSLRDPGNPVLLDEVTAEDLRLQGDPPVDFSPDAAPRSTTRARTRGPRHASRASRTRTARPTSRAST